MNSICIISMNRADVVETLAKLLEEISTNNIVRVIDLTGIEDCLQGIEMVRCVMSCQQLVVIRKYDGTISPVCEKLVDLAVEMDTYVYYFD